jgi:hypothetical protein
MHSARITGSEPRKKNAKDQSVAFEIVDGFTHSGVVDDLLLVNAASDERLRM